MGLLFPLYLLGALAIAIPIALHLRRRPPKDRVVFSSLMFLDPQVPLKKRRSKLENLFLLALRCLAFLILALLFSRPFFRDRNALAGVDQGTTRVLLVDRSASMQRTGFWEAAVEQISEIAAEFEPSDRVALLAFDAEPELLLGFDHWRELPSLARKEAITEEIERLDPSWAATALDAALIEAVGLLEDEMKSRRGDQEIILVSDLQTGARREGLENFAWPEDIILRLVPVGEEAAENASAHLVAQIEAEDGEQDREPALRVRVTNSGDATTEKFSLVWESGEATALDVLLPPGATRVISAPPRPESGGRFLELRGDTESFDNRVFVAPPQARPVHVLFLGDKTDSADTNSPLFYLERALNPTETLSPEMSIRRSAEVTKEDVLLADVIALQAVPTPEQGEWINAFLNEGGVVFLALWESKEPMDLLKESGMKISEAEVDDYAMLEQIDYDHPVLRPFAAPGLRDFSKIHFWKYRTVALSDPLPDHIRVLAKFDSGDPAWLEIRVGRGRIFMFASDWVPSESQLSLSSKFVPLIYSMMQTAGFDSDAKRQFYVGDRLPVPNSDAKIMGPDGAPSSATVATPGVYTVTHEGEDLRFAVNVPVEESRLEPLLSETFTSMGITLSNSDEAVTPVSGAQKVHLESVELEEQQKLWKWMILAVVVILLVETWVANRRGIPEAAVST